MLAARGLTVAAISESATSASTASGSSASASAKTSPAASKKSASQSSASKRTTPASQAHSKAPKAGRPTRRERLPFLQALYDLTSSNLSSGEAIRLLSVRLKEPPLRSLCQGLWEQISEGATLSNAMAAYPHIFDSSTINLIAAGESTGSITETLNRVITHQTQQQDLRREIISALAYPIFMFFVAGGVVLFFLFYLLPKMQNLLTSLGGKLPTSTQLLVGLSNFAVHYGVFILIGFVFLATAVWRWSRTDSGRHTLDTWTLKLPLIGSLAAARTVLSISQTLSILLENGITTSEALKMTERQIANVVHKEAFAQASSRIMEGDSLSTALARTHCFPDLVLDRIAVGENTGNIVPSLKDIGRNYQKSIAIQLNTTTRIFTTVFMLAVFAFVAFIAFAIVSAVLSMSAGFKH